MIINFRNPCGIYFGKLSCALQMEDQKLASDQFLK